MKDSNPQYIGADGRFTRERPKWMPPKGLQAPRLEDLLDPEILEALPRAARPRTLSADFRLPNPSPYKTPKITPEAAERIAAALHILLNQKESITRHRR